VGVSIGGPKGPANDGRGARILPLRPEIQVPTTSTVDPAAKVEKSDKAHAPVDGFTVGGATSATTHVPTHGPAGKPTGQSAMDARILALTTNAAPLTIKSSKPLAPLVVVDTPQGRVVQGSVHLDSAAAVHALEGVVAIHGDLVISESKLRSHQLVALSSLQTIEGRLVVEGNATLSSLEMFANLTHVKDAIYVGYNDVLGRVDFPKLARCDAALIVESNPFLETVQLPQLSHGARYLDVHENPSLTLLQAPSLRELSRLSLRDNVKLKRVEIGSTHAPLALDDVEVAGNGASVLKGLHTQAR
jgi:hypothetical protein